MPPRWLLALLVVALAFGLGYGVRRLVDDEESDANGTAGLAFRQAASVRLGTTPEQLLRLLDQEPHAVRRDEERNLRCLVYPVSDRPETTWSFCFRGGRLSSSATSPG